MSIDRDQTPEMDRRRRRLVWVRVLRRTLPVAAGVVMVAVIGQATWRGLASMRAIDARPDSGARMVNPSFSGQAPDGSRYMVTAVSGMRDPQDAARIVLEEPRVTVTRGKDGGATRTQSQRGVFREDDLTLRLEGDVKVDDGSGSRFVAGDAVINTSTGQVSGQGVHYQSPTGEVRSRTYAVDEEKGRMVFKGGVRARIDGR